MGREVVSRGVVDQREKVESGLRMELVAGGRWRSNDLVPGQTSAGARKCWRLLLCGRRQEILVTNADCRATRGTRGK